MKISGHQKEKKFLKDAAASKRLHQSYLFCGADGIGKRLVAEWFASFLFCENVARGESEPCFECGPCQKIAHRTHPDFIFIEREDDKKDISVEQIRDLQSAIQMHPMEADRKLIIINDAERMNAAAANSMLKTLEEPPKETHFILVSSRPHMLLPTILSRCQKLQFSPLGVKEVERYLLEDKVVEPMLAAFAAHVSSGSIGFAVDFPQEAMSEVSSYIKKTQSGISPAEIVAICERWSKSPELQVALLAALAAIYNDVLSVSCRARKPMFESLADEIEKIASSTRPDGLKRRVSAIFTAQNELEATYNKQLMFEQLLFTLQS